MVELGQFAFELILDLVYIAIKESVDLQGIEFFLRRKIVSRIETATAAVVEPLIPFLNQEGISQEKQYRLIKTCIDELRPIIDKPELLFQGSLDGQKIFENLYRDRNLPETILEDGLKEVYMLLCPRIATLLCKIPAAIKDWENEAWSEQFHRLDEVTSQLRSLYNLVDELATSTARDADETLNIVRRTLAQKIRLELDITGLRSDKPLEGKFDDYFVYPELINTEEQKKDQKINSQKILGNPDDSFNYFIFQQKIIVILGTAGSGKSTWTKWLHREALSSRWKGISVRVELRRFSNERLVSFHQLIREAVGKHFEEELDNNRIGQWIKTKNVLFVLDGFDEISPDQRDQVCEWIMDLRAATPGCPIVLTSRPLTTDHLLRLGKGWQYWEIVPFDDNRIITYIKNWYAHTNLSIEGSREVDCAELALEWGADPTIAPLTGNPLLLSTLLMVHHLDGNLPNGRSQLYRRYIDGMLDVWDDRRHVSAIRLNISLNDKYQLVRCLAIYMFLNDKEQLDETIITEWLKEYLAINQKELIANDLLAFLWERSELIVGPGIYSFAHKTITEFLVADAIFQGDQLDEKTGLRLDRLTLFDQRKNDRWNNVTFLWAGLASIADVEAFCLDCIKSGDLALGSGLLNDQYNKFPFEIRRNIMLEVLRGDYTPLKTISSTWVADGNLEGMEVKNYELRGINYPGDLDDLLAKAIADRVITPYDIEIASENIRYLAWLRFMVFPTSDDMLKSTLKFTPRRIFRDKELRVITDWASNNILFDIPSYNLYDYYLSMCAQFSEISKFFAITLFGLVFYIMKTFENSKLNVDKYKNYLYIVITALNKIPVDNLNPLWVKLTNNWRYLDYLHEEPSEEDADLFETILMMTEKQFINNILTHDELLDKTINLITELKKFR